MLKITRHFRTILFTAALLTAALAVGPQSANAHTITPQACARIALAEAREVPPATVVEWRKAFAACMADARAHAIMHACAGRAPLPLVGRIPAKSGTATLQQRRNVTVALNVAHSMRAPRSHLVAVIAAAMQEQGLSNLPYGHGTSVGFLQLIDLHGSERWRMEVTNSAGWFLRGAKRIDPHGRRAPGELAQDVQGSAHPTLYRQWVPKARRIVATYLRPCQR